MKDLSEMTQLEKFEIFVNKELKQYKKRVILEGSELSGRELSREEMIQAIKQYYHIAKNGEESEYMANAINFDVEAAAERAFNDSDDCL